MKRFLLVLVLIVAAAGLAAGTWQVTYARGEAAGRTAVTAARADFLPGRPGGGSGAGGTGGGQGGRAGQAPVAGTIATVDGSALTLTPEAGSVTVILGEQTRIGRQVPASPSDLKAGDRVLVTGARSADGAVTAATVQIQGQ